MILTADQAKQHIQAALKKGRFREVRFSERTGRVDQPGYEIVCTDLEIRVCHYAVAGAKVGTTRTTLQMYKRCVARALGPSWQVVVVTGNASQKVMYLRVTT